VPKILQKSIQRKLNVKLTRTWQIFPMVSITLLDILGVIRFSWVGLRESTKYKFFFSDYNLMQKCRLDEKTVQSQIQSLSSSPNPSNITKASSSQILFFKYNLQR
jgi:hypothetical protein